MEKELLRLVDKYRINKDKLLVQSFSQDSLKIMNELDSSVKLVQLISYRSNATITDEQIAQVKEYAMGVGPNHTYLNEEYIQKVVNSGLEIHPYTVNDKERMKQLINWGVTGMFTNFPDRLHEVKKGKIIRCRNIQKLVNIVSALPVDVYRWSGYFFYLLIRFPISRLSHNCKIIFKIY